MKKNSLIFLPLLLTTLFIPSCGCQHEYDEGQVVNPTCEDEGYTLYHCTKCNEEFQEERVNALGHDYKIYVSSTLDLETNVGDEINQCVRCDRTSTTHVSSVNTKEKGVKEFTLGDYDDYVVCASDAYDEEFLTLIVRDLDQCFKGELYYSFKPDQGLFYNEAFKTTFNESGKASTYGYNSGDYTINRNNLSNYWYDEEENYICFEFYYEDYGLTYEEALGNFAFYFVFDNEDSIYEYQTKNPYVLKGHSQTWIKVNENNRFYYTTKYQTHVCENWTRPDITKAETNWTHICREETPEAAIVSTLIAQEQGATNVDVNLLYLKPAYRNLEDMKKIFHSFKDIGTISVYYNSSVSQQERMDTLKLSVEAGAGGVDFQGFMFHDGSTLNTHTSENVKYWEDKGYDMSFIKASPKETVIDPEEDAKQIEYINEIHALGGKVLQSAHTGAEFTRKQAVAYGKFVDRRGVDIIKIVSHANDTRIFEETVLANRDAYYDEDIKAKFSIHTNNSSISDISRVIGPLFYHTYMVFHYVNLCKLQMMMEFLNNKDIDFDDTISVTEAMNRLKGKTRDPEFNYLYNEYLKLPAPTNNEAYALGQGSDMSDRWTFSNEDTSLKMRSATGTNSFSIRGAAYNLNNYSNNFEIETSISGFFKPYTSSSRIPKFGLFIGDQEHMLAFTYNFRTKSGVGNEYSVGVFTNSYLFSYDTKTKDALDTSLIDEVSVDSNVVTGDDMRLKMKYNNGELSLYYSTSLSGNMTLLKTFTYNEISPYFTHDSNKKTYFGNVVEVYMGSTSVGYDNIVYFNNTITKN